MCIRDRYGEWLARKYLQKRNFYILQKNWQSPLDARREIDLIARDGECLVFIEVRSRSIGSLNTGYHTINHKKRSSLLSACRDFLRIEFPKFPNYRFDVIEVDLCKTSGKVLHMKTFPSFHRIWVSLLWKFYDKFWQTIHSSHSDGNFWRIGRLNLPQTYAGTFQSVGW